MCPYTSLFIQSVSPFNAHKQMEEQIILRLSLFKAVGVARHSALWGAY